MRRSLPRLFHYFHFRGRFTLCLGLALGILVGLVFSTNAFINMAVLGFLRPNWRENLYAGAPLSQIGEFSFLLATLGRQANAVETSGCQPIISVIALTLLLSNDANTRTGRC